MKKLFCSLLLIAIFASVSPAANFVEVVRDENFLILIDAESIQDKGSYYVVWSKWIPRSKWARDAAGKYKKPVSHTMNFDAYKKDSKECQITASYVYDNDGGILDSGSSEVYTNRWQPIVPQTYGDIVYQSVMRIALQQ